MSSDFHKEAVFNSADLDLINTSNIMTCDLTPVNKCSCSVIDFWLPPFLVWLPSGPSHPCPSHPCPSLCPARVMQKENLRYRWGCFPAWPHPSNRHPIVPGSPTKVLFPFFLDKSSAPGNTCLTQCLLASSLPHLLLRLLLHWENRKRLMCTPHFSKMSSLSPFILLPPPSGYHQASSTRAAPSTVPGTQWASKIDDE